MKDGCLHVLDINTGKNIQTPSTQSQVSTWLRLHPTLPYFLSPTGTPILKNLFFLQSLNE